MKKIYHLSTCTTCKRILKELNVDENFNLQDIKSEAITESQLDEMAKMAGSYEALFSRRSQKFRPMGLHEKNLTENDYKRLILQEYTFLKRPVIILENEIFIGNSKKVVEAAKAKLAG